MFMSSGVRPSAFCRWKMTFGIPVQPDAARAGPHFFSILRSAATGFGVVFVVIIVSFSSAKYGQRRQCSARVGAGVAGGPEASPRYICCVLCSLDIHDGVASDLPALQASRPGGAMALLGRAAGRPGQVRGQAITLRLVTITPSPSLCRAAVGFLSWAPRTAAPMLRLSFMQENPHDSRGARNR